MASFHEMDWKELSFNPFTKISKQWMLVTAGSEEKSNTMTASWGGLPADHRLLRRYSLLRGGRARPPLQKAVPSGHGRRKLRGPRAAEAKLSGQRPAHRLYRRNREGARQKRLKLNSLKQNNQRLTLFSTDGCFCLHEING